MNNVASLFAILASAFVVAAGLATLTRAIWKAAQDVRDNKQATQANTRALAELKALMDGRIAELERWRRTVEARLGRRRLAARS